MDLKALEFLIGNWKTAGQIKNSASPEKGKISGTDSYEWVLGGRFILHRVKVKMGGERTEALELIGGNNPGQPAILFRSFDNQGAFTVMEGVIDKNGDLLITGDGMRSRLAKNGNGTMTARWEKMEDNSWQDWMELQFEKIPV